MLENKATILVVDDDPIDLKILKKMLSEKYNVDCLTSGEEAIEYLKSTIPDLILLDIHMTGKDGFEVNRMIKSDSHCADIAVVFLTGDDDRETEIKCFKEGAHDYIKKPYVVEILLQRVNRIVELNRLQKKLGTEVEKQTRKAEERRKKVERLSLQVMTTLARTIDAKDKYTNGHSVRVAEYAREIARRYGKSEKEQQEIYYMGLLHDIGKIGIPDDIINKISWLNDEEYDIIKTHPVIGADILKNISEIPGIEIGARWHHEKYDGSGYPDGLRGKDIPEVARIICVADAYDAMTSNRSYRKILAQDTVREEIIKEKGTQFDPEFADIMIEMIDEDIEYKMRGQ